MDSFNLASDEKTHDAYSVALSNAGLESTEKSVYELSNTAQLFCDPISND
jgi:hypothetical protein